MTIALTMPRLGETVTEGTILKWLKSEGDYVKKDEYIVEISTAKVETEIPSPASGMLDKILATEDQTVAVGAELALIEETATPGIKTEAAIAPGTQRMETIPAEEAGVQAGAQATEGAVFPAKAQPEAAEAAPEIGFISPIVRKLAREHNVDLHNIVGTGENGRITRDDVKNYVKYQKEAPAIPTAVAPPISPAPQPPAEVPEREIPGAAAVTAEKPLELEKPAAAPAEPAVAPGHPGEHIVPIDHLRREIAAHMTRSRQTAAHVTAIVEIDMTNVSKQRAQVKDTFKKREGFSLTYLPFVARATIDALRHFPTLNARIVDEHNMALHDYVNLGIAVAVENGLIVPVIKHAEEMNMLGLAHKIRDLAGKARGGTLTPDDVTGSTFTITNPGSFGSIIQTPIINQPNVAILSFELIQKRPVVIDDSIAIRDMVFMPLSYDHRLIDGALAAQFLSRIKKNLEEWDFSPDLAGIA